MFGASTRSSVTSGTPVASTWASLQGQPTPFSSREPLDTQEPPRRWLRQSEGHTPEDTVRALRDGCAAEALALGARLAEPVDALVDGPYGRIHWTVFSAHVFWDAWLHAGDGTEVLGAPDRSTPTEAMAALYGLLIASMPALRLRHRFQVTLALTGNDAASSTASIVPGRAGPSARRRPPRARGRPGAVDVAPVEDGTHDLSSSRSEGQWFPTPCRWSPTMRRRGRRQASWAVQREGGPWGERVRFAGQPWQRSRWWPSSP